MDQQFAGRQAFSVSSDQPLARFADGDIVRHCNLLAKPGAGDNTLIHVGCLGTFQSRFVERKSLCCDQSAMACRDLENLGENRKGTALDIGTGFPQTRYRSLKRRDHARFGIVKDHGLRNHQL